MPLESTESLIATDRSVIVQGKDGSFKINKVFPIPSLGNGMALVKVKAVALNWWDKRIAVSLPAPGSVCGSDFSGVIVALGPPSDSSSASDSTLRIGQRVCGAVFGSNPRKPEDGAFTNYLTVDVDMLLPVPPHLSWEEAAAIGGMGHGIVNLAMWQALKLPSWPQSLEENDEVYVLVYGGSTAVGDMAIQILQGLGYIPLVVASRFSLSGIQGRHLVPECHLFPHISPTCGEDIRQYTQGKLHYALDCIGDGHSTEICYTAMGRDGQYAYLEQSPEAIEVFSSRKEANANFVMDYELFGEEIRLDNCSMLTNKEKNTHKEKSHDARRRNTRWLEVMQNLLAEGHIKPSPAVTLGDGLEGVLKGFEMLTPRVGYDPTLVYLLD